MKSFPQLSWSFAACFEYRSFIHVFLYIKTIMPLYIFKNNSFVFFSLSFLL